MPRSDFSNITADLLARFKALLLSAVASVSPASPAEVIAAVEIVGGGVRMPSLQAIISSIFGDAVPLGAKLDDSSVALGAALLTLRATDNPAEGIY